MDYIFPFSKKIIECARTGRHFYSYFSNKCEKRYFPHAIAIECGKDAIHNCY